VVFSKTNRCKMRTKLKLLWHKFNKWNKINPNFFEIGFWIFIYIPFVIRSCNWLFSQSLWIDLHLWFAQLVQCSKFAIWIKIKMKPNLGQKRFVFSSYFLNTERVTVNTIHLGSVYNWPLTSGRSIYIYFTLNIIYKIYSLKGDAFKALDWACIPLFISN